jgi:hypothetical protein
VNERESERRGEDEWERERPTGERRPSPSHGGRSSDYGRGAAYSGTTREDFRGRGPRGYERSSERIYEDVCEALTEHPDVDASEIQVEVADGIVTLRGTVEERRQKRLAEDIAERAGGVRDVRNLLELERGMVGDLSERASSRRNEHASHAPGAATGLGDFRNPGWRDADLRGFDVEASDGNTIGTVDDASEPGSDHVVVDTGPWIFGRKVVLPAGLIGDIDFDSRLVLVDSSREVIKNAPEFDEAGSDDPEYRERLRGYYEGHVRGGRRVGASRER